MDFVYKGILGVMIGTVSFMYKAACQFKPASMNEINEVFFLNNTSLCCMGGDANCVNLYCKAKAVGRIIEIINAAQQSISFCMYMFSVEELSNAIIKAHNRGVYVRAIADSKGISK